MLVAGRDIQEVDGDEPQSTVVKMEIDDDRMECEATDLPIGNMVDCSSS